MLFKLGVTFNVYSDNQGTERIFPFDVVPRVVPSDEWQWLERGLKQRIKALNCFLDDIYNDQKIIKDGLITREVVESATGFLEPCLGLKPPKEFGAILLGRIWFEIATATGTCLKTISVAHPVSPMS